MNRWLSLIGLSVVGLLTVFFWLYDPRYLRGRVEGEWVDLIESLKQHRRILIQRPA